MNRFNADSIELLIQLIAAFGCFLFFVIRKPRFWLIGTLCVTLGGLGATGRWFFKNNSGFTAMHGASQVNKAGPRNIDEDLRLDGAISEGDRLIYRFTLRRLNFHQIDRSAWRREVVPRIRKAAASEPGVAEAKQAGVRLSARFYSADRVLVDEISFEDKESPQPSPISPPAPALVFREFENRNGAKIRARLVRFDGSAVTIEREAGGIFTNPIEIYSDADQAYIRAQEF